mmetsp:Transcript_8400/g.19900  ORF Transcript_8400/g.19900 Transcript_8400/m.19900 type:complete len:239 (+) Transcript_8400:247-963(+)|eukprot:CAMPEP_0198337638 /NCGR_PEP_ID=MMETSP1450-20131203/29611_1 /TAXON_ID=753684 ORGANISM="Madagascaria erythrocladiodes, Strain CCMP3234" /NCGR_SAMPLE_ID=MMETSP1450 /ASSEMBLY_ACC=CAM_ASM_001115 /LENGTH=238 /DNA_ID=CAMNT_0044042465 /DNA_START=192 /DNA_END=908 /DNA_ORIENTATION=+
MVRQEGEAEMTPLAIEDHGGLDLVDEMHPDLLPPALPVAAEAEDVEGSVASSTPATVPVPTPKPVVSVDASEAEHVTIWNRAEKRKIAGNAAPLRRNLDRYLNNHPDCEVYKDQDIAAGMKRRKVAKPKRPPVHQQNVVMTVGGASTFESHRLRTVDRLTTIIEGSSTQARNPYVELDPWLVGTGGSSSDEEDDPSVDAVLGLSQDLYSASDSGSSFQPNVYLSLSNLPSIGQEIPPC